MLRNNETLLGLQKQFHKESLSNLDKMYYELACDIQDRVLKDYHRIYGEELRDLDESISQGRIAIKRLTKK